MFNFYIGGQLTWEQYLKTVSGIKDLKEQIRRLSKKQQIVISEQTREIVASREALTKKFAAGFDSLNVTLEWGLGRLENVINGIGVSIDALRASFDYGMALMIEQLQLQNQTMAHFLQQMEAIHATLENPTLTQAREFYRIGCDRLTKGLLDKALDAFLESEKKDDTNFMTELAIGKLYLYGVNEDSNVIDLRKAEHHLRAAARYAKAETPRLPEASRFAGEALLHASIACYAQANAQVMSGNTAEAQQSLQKSYELASQAAEVYPKLSETHYHRAKFAALLGDGKTAAASLERAIALDEAYCLKAGADFDFRFVLSDVTQLFQRLRNSSGEYVRQKIQRSEKLLTDWVYLSDDAKSTALEIRQTLNEAKTHVARNTYFDNQDAQQLVQEAEQKFQSLLVHNFALHTLSAHIGRITCLAFSPDQTMLATGGGDRKVKLWSLPDYELLLTFISHEDTITDLVFSHDSLALASVDQKGSVKLWNVVDGMLLYNLLKPESPVQCLAFSPDDTKLAVGGYNRQATVWDLRDGSLIHTLNLHKSSVETVVFSTDGRLLATGSPDNTAALWEVSTGQLLHTFGECSGLGSCLAFHSDDTVLILGSSDGSVRFYQVHDGKPLYVLPERSGMVTWLALSPNSNILATVNYGKAVQLWDIPNSKLLHNLKPFSPGITSVRFNPEGTLVAASDFHDRSVKLWNVRDGQLMHVIAGNITCNAFSPDGTLLVTGDENGNLKFWGRMVTARESLDTSKKPQAKSASPRTPERKPQKVVQVETSPRKQAESRSGTVAVKQQPMRPKASHAQETLQRSANDFRPQSASSDEIHHLEAELERLLDYQQRQAARMAKMGRCLECGRKLGFFARLWGLKFCKEHGF